MPMSCLRVAALAIAALLAGCSFPTESLLPGIPTLTAPDPRGTDVPHPAASTTPPAAAATPLPGSAGAPSSTAPSSTGGVSATTLGQPPGSSPPGSTSGGSPRGNATSTSTLGGTPSAPTRLQGDLKQLQDEVAGHMAELQRLRRQLDELGGAQDGLVAGIETRLRSANVPNDPQLSDQANQAQTQLVRYSDSIARLNNLASYGTSDAALASYVQQAIRAALNDSTISEPDRRQLLRLDLDAGRASASVDQLVTQTSGEIAARSLYLSGAHRRLASLGSNIAAGQQQAFQQQAAQQQQASAPPLPPPQAAAAATAASGRRALVTIRFDRPNVAYQDELYNAVKQTLDRRPDAAFDIVAVAPPGQAVGNTAAAERNVENVVKALGNMGLPPDRFRLSAATLADAVGNEVRIYVR